MIRTRLANEDDEAGLALIMVILFSVITMALVMVALSTGVGALKSSRDHVAFEDAVTVAENGIDEQLARLQYNQAYNTGQTAPTTFSSADAERTWAKAQLLAQVSSGLKQTGLGSYVAIKPTNRQTVYSLGWAPSYGAPHAKARLLKAEYIFAPYKPANAILTAGDLTFSSSVTVDVRTGAVSSSQADVHTNGNLSGTGSSPQVNGTVTSSGSYQFSGSSLTGSGGSTPLQAVPTLDPRYVYTLLATSYPTTWYDLCPDGVARVPSTTPCTGATATNGTTSPFRGWTYSVESGIPTWTQGTLAPSGVYYVYQGNAVASKNTDFSSVSVLAEAASSGGPTAKCGKKGGDITWKLTGIGSAAIPGIVMLAGGDLTITANAHMGTGLFGAVDQVHINTSSTGITGSVIANDVCKNGGDVNEVKNAVVNYDPDGEIPISSIIRTTQWLEYSGLQLS